MTDSKMFTRAEVADYLGVKVETLRQYTARTRRAMAKGEPLMRDGHYLRFPLPDGSDRWPAKVIEAYKADADARTDGRRRRTRGPASRVLRIAGVEHMVLQVEYRITRDELWAALRAWRVTHREVPMPTNRAGLLAATKWSLEAWGAQYLGAFGPTDEDIAEVTAAVNILWPEEA